MSSNNVINMTVRANMDVSQMSNGITQMQGILQKLKLPDEMKKNFTSLFSTATSELEKYQSKLNSGFKTKGDITGLEKSTKTLNSLFSQIESEWNKLQGIDLSKVMKLDGSAQAKIKELDTEFKNLGTTLQNQVGGNVQKAITLLNQLGTSTSKKKGGEIANLLGAGEYEKAIAVLDQLIVKQQQAVHSFDKGDKSASSRGQTLIQYEAIRDILTQIIPNIQQYNLEVNNIRADKAQVVADGMANANNHIQQGVTTAQNLSAGLLKAGDAALSAANKTHQLSYDMDMIKSRVQYFFSLTNAAMLFRRVFQDTINTTKELDAAMTETAVVTDFSVSDMWKELPRYTALAKDLGATIKGVYETMTLYYQQGLQTNEVMEVGTETLKMARIAGLDYAKAADFMTAALRGFNMEVNEMNAQRVNDVYSNLAAITAADTQEIATAMTKTASIASSANMEFETTAAFLSQIIETTRESAETAGTAMKTVIARFTELKKDPAEIGEVDGEVVDANKIETALKTIDVALRDTSGQFRDLDDVFLDIAEKWDGLDTNTQRYIATMAAGSRQQSRFIAMMSDYSRTMELVGAANNSAGASQRQFDKTLETLEAKINRLKTAWQEFTMGIANNSIIKKGIDLLTWFLETINKISENAPGASKGILNLGMAIAGLAIARKIAHSLLTSFTTAFAQANVAAAAGGAAAGVSYSKGFHGAVSAGLLGIKSLFSKIFSKTTWFGTLTVEQAKINYLTSQGLSLKQAEFAIQKNLTNAAAKKIAIQRLEVETGKVRNQLTKEEIAEKQALILAEMEEQSVQKMGLFTKIKYLAMLLFGNQATRESAYRKFVEAGATWAQKGAQDALNKSMLACPIGAIVAGLAVLVVAIVAVVNAIKKSTLEYKMEQAAIATEKAKKAATQAKTAYDDLVTSISDIGTAEEELENLTEGTLEWQQALLEVNSQIMELIDKFPNLRSELMNELTVEANGQLKLSEEGYRIIQEAGLQQYKNALASQTVASVYEANLNYQNQQKELVLDRSRGADAETWWDKVEDLVGYNEIIRDENKKQTIKDIYDGLNKEYSKDSLYTEVDELAEELGLGVEELKQYRDALVELEKANLEFTKATRNYTNQILLSYASDDFKNRDDFEGIAEVSSSLLGKNYDFSEIDSIAANINENNLRDVANRLGVENFNETGSFLVKLRKLYFYVTGIPEEEIESLFEEDEEAIKKALAEAEVGKKIYKISENFAKDLDKFLLGVVDDKQKQLIHALLTSTNGATLTLEDLETYKESEDLQVFLQNLWNSSEALRELFDNNQNAYDNFILNQEKQGSQTYDEASRQIVNLGIISEKDRAKLFKSLSAGTVEELSNRLTTMYNLGGDAKTLRAFLEKLTQITTELSEEQTNTFYSQLLGGTSWSSTQSLEEFNSRINQLGIYIDQTDLNSLITQIEDINNASQAVDLSQLGEQLRNITQLSRDIDQREKTERTFSADEVEKYTKIGVTEFVQYGDEYIYYGKSLQKLLEATKEKGRVILKETEKQINQQKNTALITQDFGKAGAFTLNRSKTLNPNAYYLEIKGILGEFYNHATDPNNYGFKDTDIIAGTALSVIKKYAEKTDLTDTDKAQLEEIFTNLKAGLDLDINALNNDLQAAYRTYGQDFYFVQDFSEIAAAATQSEDPLQQEQATITLLSLASYYDNLQDEIAAYYAAKEKGNEEEANYFKILLANKLLVEKNIENLGELNDRLKEHINLINTAKKGSQNYFDRLNNLAADLNYIFGVNLTGEFFSQDAEKNLNLIEQAVLGVNGSFEKFLKNMISWELDNSDFFKNLGDLSGLKELFLNLYLNEEGLANGEQIISFLAQRGLDPARVLEKLGFNQVFDEEGKMTTLIQNSWYAAAESMGLFEEKMEKLYDSFYNYASAINTLIYERNKLEQEYELLAQNNNATAQDYIDNYDNRLKSLYKELRLQKQIVRMRQLEQKALVAKNSSLSEYAKIENGQVVVNDEAINAVASSDLRKKIQDYIDTLNKSIEEEQKATESILENTIAMESLADDWKEIAADFEKELYDAIVEKRESQIEDFEDISEAIGDSNSELIDAIQKEINSRRQARDNQKTEEELGNKERRLAYLQRDSSGAYDQEILELQKELLEEREDYTDTLIDQKISELEEQNDEAAKQREKQIKLMENQLENDKSNGNIAAEVRDLLKSESNWSTVSKILGEASGLKEMTDINREIWTKTNKTKFTETIGYLNHENVLSTIEEALIGASALGIFGEYTSSPLDILFGEGKDDGMINYMLDTFSKITNLFGTGASNGYTIDKFKTDYKKILEEAGIKDDETIEKIYNDYASGGGNVPDLIEKYKKEPQSISKKTMKVAQKYNVGARHGTGLRESYWETKDAQGNSTVYKKSNLSNWNKETGFVSIDEGATPVNKLYINEEYYKNGWQTGVNGTGNIKTIMIGTKSYTSDLIHYDDNGYYLTASEFLDPDYGYIYIPAYGVEDTISASLLPKTIDKADDFPGYDDPNAKGHYGPYQDAINSDLTILEIAEDNDGRIMYKVGYKDTINYPGETWVAQKHMNWLSDAYLKKTTAFKTGGLADFTGPAWLDGTKSRPELVLNQRDTQNFLQLKDVLGSFMKNHSISNTSVAGDTNYEISINVEKMTSDYDVEQVAQKIKQIIVTDATYRNSNIINRLR